MSYKLIRMVQLVYVVVYICEWEHVLENVLYERLTVDKESDCLFNCFCTLYLETDHQRPWSLPSD